MVPNHHRGHPENHLRPRRLHAAPEARRSQGQARRPPGWTRAQSDEHLETTQSPETKIMHFRLGRTLHGNHPTSRVSECKTRLQALHHFGESCDEEVDAGVRHSLSGVPGKLDGEGWLLSGVRERTTDRIPQNLTSRRERVRSRFISIRRCRQGESRKVSRRALGGQAIVSDDFEHRIHVLIRKSAIIIPFQRRQTNALKCIWRISRRPPQHHEPVLRVYHADRVAVEFLVVAQGKAAQAGRCRDLPFPWLGDVVVFFQEARLVPLPVDLLLEA